jgi:Ca2+-binding EF-hand superfamily protein/RNA polymerase subunit RPABC4/transcription elongation factor Spt4
MYIIFFFLGNVGVAMSNEENQAGSMAECGACRELIPIDSPECPSCGVSFSGISDQALGECGACNKLVPIDSTKCPECGVVFVADDVVDVLRAWLSKTGISVSQLFERFDVDGNGIIDSDELRNGLLDLNLADLPPSQVERLVETIDENGDGEIDLGELEIIIEGDSAKEMGFSESVLERVMKSYNITNRFEFIAFASRMDEDENRYLKESELKKAAALFVQGEPNDEVVEQTTDEVEEPVLEDEEQVEEEHTIDDDVDIDDEVVEDNTEEEIFEDEDEIEESNEDDDEVEDEESIEEDEDVHSEYIDDDLETEDVDEEEIDEDDEVDFVPGQHKMDAFEKLVALMDDQGVSVTRFFNNLDKNADGKLSYEELNSAIQNELQGSLTEEEITELMEHLDEDGDGEIDLIEFIQSLEEHEEGIEEAKKEPKEKVFPTVWQKRMMSKQWNDIIYPIAHTLFGLLIVALLFNGIVGPVDGSGGSVAQDTADGFVIIDEDTTRLDGAIYPCDKTIQIGECANSLTPLAGDASSMPKGFYWDGILGLVLSTIGLITSLTLHFYLAPAWRARMRAMKEVQGDKADAQEYDDAFVKLGEFMVENNLTIREVFEQIDADNDYEIDGPEFQRGIEAIVGDALAPQHIQAILEELDADNSGKIDPEEFITAILNLDMGIRSDYDEQDDQDQEEDQEGSEFDDFQLGDFIGLVLYDDDGNEIEDVFGTIIEFDDEEETVTIEEDETGDEITGYLEDAFFPEE